MPHPHTMPLAFIDLELSGLDLLQHEIIEIGLVLVQPIPWTVIEEYSVRVIPKHIEKASPESLKVVGYSEEGWKNAISLHEALEQLAEKTKGAVMVSHNVAFDYAFLAKAFAEQAVANKMHYHKLDTISVAYARLSDTDIARYSLQYLCHTLGIPLEGAHSALGDARACALLYKHLMHLA